MGHKIFVSYKYADNNVMSIIPGTYSTVRDYVDFFEFKIGNNIYKGESDGEDLSVLSENTIWEKLKDRIYDSTLTLVFISPNMKSYYKIERDQWIPWEISYSLKENSRRDKSGRLITSKTNAMIAVILPDRYNSYSYYFDKRTCCSNGCLFQRTNILFNIIHKNMFNSKVCNREICGNSEKIWHGPFSYIEAVEWTEFISNISHYIDKAYERRPICNL